MIPPTDALHLPSAQLSEEQRAAADKLEAEIEAHVQKNMERRGAFGLQVRVTDPNVVAEVNVRLRAAGWQTQLEPWTMESAVNPRQRMHVGWKIQLQPTDEAYRAAYSLVAN